MTTDSMDEIDARSVRRSIERRILTDIILGNGSDVAAEKIQNYIDILRDTYHSAIKSMAKDSR
jgi:hypothetical protein